MDDEQACSEIETPQFPARSSDGAHDLGRMAVEVNVGLLILKMGRRWGKIFARVFKGASG